MAGLVIVALVYGIGKELGNTRTQEHKNKETKKIMGSHTGLLAGFLLLATPLFLSTTKSASLDMVVTAFISAAVYFYLLAKKAKKQKSKRAESWLIILTGILIGLGIMTRSLLALTPIAVILVDLLYRRSKQSQTFYEKSYFKGFVFILLIALIIALPWHIYMWSQFGNAFLQTYLGFNLIEHAVNLTPGYQPTQPWFYIVVLIKHVPWLVPVLVGGGLFILFQNSKFKIQKTSLDKSNDSSLNGISTGSLASLEMTFLLLWFFVPFIALSMATTRHEWYIVQALPPLAILMAILIQRAYQAIQACKSCSTVLYLAQITFATFVLASIIAVLTVPDPSAAPVKALRWLRENTDPNQPVYVLNQRYLPHTLLFHPKKVKLVAQPELANILASNEANYIYVADQDLPAIQTQFPQLNIIQTFKFGNLLN